MLKKMFFLNKYNKFKNVLFINNNNNYFINKNSLIISISCCNISGLNNINNNNKRNNNNNNNNNSMYYTTTTKTNDSNNNKLNNFFKQYILNSNNNSLEERNKMIESLLVDSQGLKIITKEKLIEALTNNSSNNSNNNSSSNNSNQMISSDILESFIKIRDDLEKYNCLPPPPQIQKQTSSSSSSSTPTVSSGLSPAMSSFDTLLGELIKENLKNNNQLYCKPLDIEKMEEKVWRQIVENEAVHPYSNLNNPIDEIKSRTGKNRTCLILFHPLLPKMPLMSLYIAFTNGIPNNMKVIEDPPSNDNDESSSTEQQQQQQQHVDSAIFYSISSLHKGLGGVNLGQILIYKAVEYISLTKPEIKNFCTLSPLPRFKKYLSKTNLNIYNKIKDNKELINEMKFEIQPIALNYIFKEKSKPNRVLDPVCNFHLKNGASIYRLNWDADESEKRLDESFGIMINYLYEIDKLELNSKNYIEKGIVSTNQIFNNQFKKSKF